MNKYCGCFSYFPRFFHRSSEHTHMLCYAGSIATTSDIHKQLSLCAETSFVYLKWKWLPPRQNEKKATHFVSIPWTLECTQSRVLHLSTIKPQRPCTQVYTRPWGLNYNVLPLGACGGAFAIISTYQIWLSGLFAEQRLK